MKNLIFLFLLLTFAMNISAQLPKMDNVLYGAAYYQEYMPSDRLADDLKLMKESGMSVVRLGESTWSLFEPREGEFEFAWMDRIIDGLYANGIQVILGTPTYSMPAWLWHKHPEVLVNYEKGNKAYYVNNYDFQISFVDYLKKKFGTTENLNKIWGLNYWGMTLNDWDEFPPRDGLTNTAYKLEWERFKRKSVADYLTWQSEIVGEYKRPDQFVMHCFMPSVQDIDQIASSKKMDIMAVNVYHGSQDNLTGDEIAFAGDFFRSVKMKNYLITETAKPLAYYDHPNFGKYPAITINNFGKGTLLYEGTVVSDLIQEKIILQEMEKAGIKTADQDLHWPLVTKSGVNDAGKKVHYYYNYTSQKSSLVYPHQAGTELTGGNAVSSGASLEIESWDVLIVEEK